MDYWDIGFYIIMIAGVGYGIYYLKQNDLLTLDRIKESVSFDNIKAMVIMLFSQPMFIFLYVIFVLTPVWVLTDFLKDMLPVVPFWQKLFLSIAGIWMVDRVMEVKGLK
jgi:hypothetical protein